MDDYQNANTSYSQMKEIYSSITNTDLWQYLENDKKGLNYAIGISRVCFDACVISETITEQLPNFTKHDFVHIKCVLDWMARLLDNKLSVLTKEETAMLIMAACCHDVGMSISKANKKELMNELETEHLGRDLKEYFRKNKDKENEYRNCDKQISNEELYDLIIRDFVRQNHHLRVEEVLNQETFNDLKGPLRKELVIALCRSHGEDLDKLKIRIDDTGVRIYLLAILLRLADILNFDISRSPNIKFKHSGLENPQNDEEKTSADEHIKNQICQWTIVDDAVVCTGECPDNQIMHDVLKYVEWVRKEVESSNRLLNETSSTNNPLIIKHVKPNLSGDFILGDYELKVNTKRVIDILGSENVYEDSRAFLTELIQNSIDAILVRTNIDHGFNIENGKIDVFIWEDNDYIWTRIDDNGFGMDENIIMNYFLTVGESFYNSHEYKKIRREGNNTFTPLNRFGIGILSCFMNQSDVQLEMETKNINSENVYRMDVTSLDGYYSLYKVDRTHKVEPITAPSFDSDLADGYNRDFGTSICVKQKMNGNDYSVERYKNYIDERINLPVVDFNLYTCKEPIKLITKNEFINSIEKVMNGRKYKNLYDHFEIFYLDSLEDYLVSYGYEKTMDSNKLKDAKVIVINVNDKIKKQLNEMHEYHGNYSNNTNYVVQKYNYELLGKWFDDNKASFNPDERRIIEHALLNLGSVSDANLTYNGITIALPTYGNYSIAYCIVNGSWFENVNLSKTKLLGLDEETDFLSHITSSVVSFWPSYSPIPYEVFEVIEQKVFDYNQDYEQKGYIELTYYNDNFSYIDNSVFVCLSYIYDMHVQYDKEKSKNLTVRFSKEDRISRENSEFRYSMFLRPVCVIEDDNTTLFYKGMLNHNYPLIKWLLSNSQNFAGNYVEQMDLIKDYLERPMSYKNLYSGIYDFLLSIRNVDCSFFDSEIIEYMESIKDKSGCPIIIEE